jgi:membrane protein implicated in regulation of membrane protease activity
LGIPEATVTTRSGVSVEKKARLSTSVAIAASAGLLAYTWLHEAIAATAVAVFVVAALYAAWVGFAFEVTPEYESAQNPVVGNLVGRACVVIESCAPRGRVRVNGEVWQAESTDGTTLAAGQGVVIRGLASNLVLLIGRE